MKNYGLDAFSKCFNGTIGVVTGIWVSSVVLKFISSLIFEPMLKNLTKENEDDN